MAFLLTIHDWCAIMPIIKIGMGGYIDEENKGFMWAETQIYGVGMQDKSLSDILEYISKTRIDNSGYDLYPEFYIC